jgi:hypothetical protein
VLIIICDTCILIYKLFTLPVTLRLEELKIILTLIPEKMLTVEEVYRNAKALLEKKKEKRRLLIHNWRKRLLIMIVIIIIIIIFRDPPDPYNMVGFLFDYFGFLITPLINLQF